MSPQRRSWSRLDNAAKIFPSTSEKTDTRVFRFSCELKESVNPDILAKAVERTVLNFPNYLCVMKKGIFWYYLEQTELKPRVLEEYKFPCSALYTGDADRLLFEVTYYKKRINLEIYHVLADGTGAIQFLRAILYRYLTMLHADELAGKNIEFTSGTSVSEKASDGFRKYYVRQKHVHAEKARTAYRLHGYKNEDDILNITEVVASVREIIAAAHRYNTTMTVFLTAQLISAIHDGMSIADEKKPVVIKVPVNLRNYFPSDTAKNFFGMISVTYDFKSSGSDFNDIINSASEQFREQLTKEKLSVRMNKLAALEHNPFVKLAPLPIKDFALRTARQIGVKSETLVISNVGRIKMPDELNDYIDEFAVYASTLKLQLCVCSFEDRLSLGFSSAFINTDIQRSFVRRLVSEGIGAEVRCNMFNNEPSEKNMIRNDQNEQ